jgi:predicted Zn-dependent protease
MAHELTHITQRHISRGISKQSAQAPWMMGAMILGILAASKDPNAGNAMIVGGQAASVQNQLNFSRDAEREADRIGFAVMTQAGYEPQGFVSMFEKLQQSSRLNDSGGFPYLRSHPLTTERIADMQARVPQKSGASISPVTPPDHAMVSARAKVLANSGVDALRLWSLELEPAHFAGLSAAAQISTLYGATFAALKLRDFAKAQASLTKLLERTRNNAAAQEIAGLLGAELALAQGSPALAAQRMEGLEGKGRSVVFMNAQIDTSAGKAERAAQNLQIWLAEHPRDALGWQLLAFANQSMGRTVAAVRDEAESNMAQLDYQSAFTRFKAAQTLARKSTDKADHIEASIVDTRARQVELMLKEQALER